MRLFILNTSRVFEHRLLLAVCQLTAHQVQKSAFYHLVPKQQAWIHLVHLICALLLMSITSKSVNDAEMRSPSFCVFCFDFFFCGRKRVPRHTVLQPSVMSQGALVNWWHSRCLICLMHVEDTTKQEVPRSQEASKSCKHRAKYADFFVKKCQAGMKKKYQKNDHI